MLERQVRPFSWLISLVRPGFPLGQDGHGNKPGPCLTLLLCVHTFVWFVFRFLANPKLPFLSSVELAVALLAGRPAGKQAGKQAGSSQQPGGEEGSSQVPLKQMIGLCT